MATKTGRMAGVILASIAPFAAWLPAKAQEAPQTGQIAENSDEAATTIIVTGSRIARSSLDATVPITSIGGDTLVASSNSIGETLNDLPSLRSTFSQSNTSRSVGLAGINLLDLRGLGSQRTLALVNGRRHVSSDITFLGVSTDINTIPGDLIERVDIVTGGSSAVYGSDAIAGVVNFILKDDFKGVKLRAKAGTSTYGDAGSYSISGVVGTNFAGDRGNVAISAEYSRQDPFFASKRPNLARNSGFVVVDTDPAGSDGVIDRRFVKDIRSTAMSIGGLIQVPSFGAGAPCGRDTNGAAFACTLLFQPDGSLTAQTGTRLGLAPLGSFDGGNGSTGSEGRSRAVFPALDRYVINLIGHFTVSEAFEPFVEAKFARTNTRVQTFSPFFQGSTIGFGADLRERPRFDNPFLSDNARAVIIAARAAGGLAPFNAASRITLRKDLFDLKPLEEINTRETYRVVGGAKGSFNQDWAYEFSVNYGELRQKSKVPNNLDTQRFLLAIDAVRDPATGQIVCRSKIDPAAALINRALNPNDPSQSAMIASFTQRLASDVAACVPLNPFGQGNISAAAKDYLAQETRSAGNIKQFVANASLTGDSRRWINLPGGPISFAIGAEYRRETNFYANDALSSSGVSFFPTIPFFDPPAFVVKEAFGEIRLPILKEIPFVKELTLSGAGRVSDYRGNTGTVFAYNLGLDYAPIADVRFRAGLARAVRAPALSGLFSGQLPGFSFVVDPCASSNIGTGSATRRANCAAAGIPAAFDFVYSGPLSTIAGGNPALTEETADSYTLGIVVEPRKIPGLSFTVDYYNISITNVIGNPNGQQILNACYDGATLNTSFCGLFRRAGAGGAAGGEVPFQIIEGSLQQILINNAKRQTRGVDVEARFSREIPGFATLSTRLTYTHVFQKNDFFDPSNPKRANQTLLELGDPKDAFNVSTSFKRGSATLGFQFRYIGKQVLNTFEDFFSVQGRAPENADFASSKFYPATFYQDVSLSLDVNARFNIRIGVDNVFNRQPPFGLAGAGGGSSIYDVRGRYFHAGVTSRF